MDNGFLVCVCLPTFMGPRCELGKFNFMAPYAHFSTVRYVMKNNEWLIINDLILISAKPSNKGTECIVSNGDLINLSSSHQKYVKDTNSFDDCVKAVEKRHEIAEGMMWSQFTKKCYAEYDVIGINEHCIDCQSCIFPGKIILFIYSLNFIQILFNVKYFFHNKSVLNIKCTFTSVCL